MALVPHPESERLARAVERLLPEARAWSGVIYRSSSPAYATSRDLLSGAGALRHGGRWNSPGKYAAVYGSLSPEIAMAEALEHYRYYRLDPWQMGRRVFCPLRGGDRGPGFANLHAMLLDIAVLVRYLGVVMMTTAGNVAGILRKTREELGVTRRIFSRLTGFSERSIASWESGREPSQQSRQRILELRRLERGLSRVMEPGAIAPWLETPNPAFDGLKPLEVIERGQTDRIWRMIFELESGVPA